MLSRARHANINRILGLSVNGPRRCLILEYMDGGALDVRLRHKRLPVLHWRDRARILLHVARGLVYMHTMKPPVIHRDVKAGNVLLSSQYAPAQGRGRGQQRSRLIAKLSDFGTVRVNREQDDAVLQTSARTHGSTAQICGTKPCE